jgi:hypothetical protein
LTFRNNYDLQSGFDGGVLEISINGGAFTDIVTAGGNFVGGGYNGALGGTNPIAPRAAWTGNSGGYILTTVNLPVAGDNQVVQLRWRETTDNTGPATAGWRIDNVNLPAATVGVFSVNWGSSTAALADTGDGRLLPAGRTTSLPWLGIQSFHIRFTSPVPLTPADVTVNGVTGGNYGPVSVTGSGADYTITLAKPIGGAGVNLPPGGTGGDRVTVTIGSVNIAPFSRRLDVLPGDYNDDGFETVGDSVAMRPALQGNDYFIFADFNGDGFVDGFDQLIARRRIGAQLP